MTKETIHYAPAYFQNPLHRIGVTLVGAGGNGSQMLSALARMDHAMRAMDRKGLMVTLWDADTVEATNVGRQLFSPCEVGLNKAQALISRFNRFYGTDWESESRMLDENALANSSNLSNIVISCVDNIEFRKTLGQRAKNWPVERTYNQENQIFYWMDLGNGKDSGQVVLGSIKTKQPATSKYEAVEKLPFLTEEFKLKKKYEKDSGPSCSMAESLKKQDLFINSTLVQMASSLLWNLLIRGYTQYRGFYLNLNSLSAVPINV